MSQSSGWIDFKELRAKLDFKEVLDHYHVQLNMKGDKASGFCPLPTHQGKRNSPSFSADLKRGIFQCFGCRAKGNVLDFSCRMEGFNPTDPRQLRTAALKIRDIFCVEGNAPKQHDKAPKAPASRTQQTLVNAPLDFELQSLDPKHPYLYERGFTDETIEHFGTGFCNRGMLKGRIAIPLHDPQGQLVGYAGRITRDDLVSEKCPKYLFPGERDRKGILLEFRKSLLLYNAHRIEKPVDHLFVVEGFAATWWLWQAGYRNVVALMGADCSDAQGELIVDLVKQDGRTRIMSDGNEAGEHCAHSVFEHVAPHRFVRWVRLWHKEQPTDFIADELEALFV